MSVNIYCHIVVRRHLHLFAEMSKAFFHHSPGSRQPIVKDALVRGEEPHWIGLYEPKLQGKRIIPYEKVRGHAIIPRERLWWWQTQGVVLQASS